VGRHFVVGVIVVALLGACGGADGRGSSTTRVTVGPLGPLEAALLTPTQLRQVPGLASATVKPLTDLTIFDDDDPRAPCGAVVPKLDLDDTAAVSIAAETIRGGVELIARLPPGAAKRYLDARQATTSKGCPEYETKSSGGQTQRVQLVRVVRLHREFEQGLAVVMALKVGTTVRAATEIELRRGDILARTVIYTNTPVSNITVRGIASLMGQNLSVFED
jgi:hypothetical protein